MFELPHGSVFCFEILFIAFIILLFHRDTVQNDLIVCDERSIGIDDEFGIVESKPTIVDVDFEHDLDENVTIDTNFVENLMLQAETDDANMTTPMELASEHPPRHPNLNSCEICNRSFTRRSNLKRHHQAYMGKCSAQFGDSFPFECDACDKRFKHNGSLRRHYEHYHKMYV